MGRGLNSYSNARDGNESRIVNLLRDMHLRVDRHDRPWDLCVCGPLGLLWRWAEVKIIKRKDELLLIRCIKGAAE